MTPRCLQQSSEGSTALWGRLVVEKLPTSLEKKKKIDVEGYILLQVGKVQKGVKNGNSVLL